jgi:hypothetical protein
MMQDFGCWPPFLSKFLSEHGCCLGSKDLWNFDHMRVVLCLRVDKCVLIISVDPMLQPHFGQVWGWNSHSQSWGLGVLRDSRKLRAWLQWSKHLALRWGSVTWRWKALDESYKIGSDPVSIGGWGEKLWWPKVLGVQNRDSFGTPLWEFWHS